MLKKTIIDKIIFAGEMVAYEDEFLIEDIANPSNRMYICLQGRINSQGVGSIFNEKPELYTK